MKKKTAYLHVQRIFLGGSDVTEKWRNDMHGLGRINTVLGDGIKCCDSQPREGRRRLANATQPSFLPAWIYVYNIFGIPDF